MDAIEYPPGSIGRMFPEVAAIMESLLAERNHLEAALCDARAERDEMRARIEALCDEAERDRNSVRAIWTGNIRAALSPAEGDRPCP